MEYNKYVVEMIFEEYVKGVATIDFTAMKVHGYYGGTIDIYPEEVEPLQKLIEDYNKSKDI